MNGQAASKICKVPHKQDLYSMFLKDSITYSIKIIVVKKSLPPSLSFSSSDASKVVLNWILTLESHCYRNTARQETGSV